MRTTIQAVALSVIAMVGTLTPGDALALHRQTPFLEPIPFPGIDGVQSFRPFCQGEAARWIAFDSTSDLLHNGSGGGEVFVWDNDPAGPRHLVQVTNCATGSSQDASTVADGKVVVFDTTSDLNKPKAQQCIAPLAHRQIMRATIKQGQIGYEQLTNDLNGDCTSPRVSADGFKIVFECTGDMRRNGSSGTHIFLWRDTKSVCDPLSIPPCSNAQQITPKGAGVSGNAELNLEADKIVFNSNQDIDGHSNGFQQIWLYDIAARPPFPEPQRLTNGNADSIKPSMDQDGRQVVFQSQADLLGTGSTGWEIFLLDRQTGVLRQLTNGTGDSTDPSMGGGGRFVLFLSTSDFSGSGVAGGPHLFIYDLIEDALYQATRPGPGTSGPPIATADTIFFFDSDEDPLGSGITGRQIYALNVFQQVPPRAIGAAKMNLLPGTPDGQGGSSVRIITESTNGADPATSYINVPIGNPGTGAGQIQMSILGRNIDGEGKVSAPKVTIPPIPVPSFGAICFQQNGTGTGTVDCNGDTGEAAPDPLDYRTLQDHVTNNPGSQPAEDPQCQFGCREGQSCPGPFTPLPNQECGRCEPQPGVCAGGPLQGHACQFDTQCPGQPSVTDPTTGTVLTPGACDTTAPLTDPLGAPHAGTCRGVGGPREGLWCDLDSDCPANCLTQSTCDNGQNEGKVCAHDTDCDPQNLCSGGELDVCEGPPVFTQSGTYGAGDLELTIPMTVKISTGVGKDGLYCTGDDTYALSGAGFDSLLRLTTGKATATISDVDYQDGVTMGASEHGAPFSCDAWENNKDLSGGRLVGAVTFLNVPSIPFPHDTILTFRFVADNPPCVGDTCPQKQCTSDSNCDDGNPCNGREFCNINNCAPGVPVVCDDGNQCNGLEQCNENTGLCGKSNGISCDDDNECTTGTCRPDFLCTYTNVANGSACDDGNLCTGQNPQFPSGSSTPADNVCPAGQKCDVCTNGTCGGPLNFGANQLHCEDNNLCNGISVCDPRTGDSCTDPAADVGIGGTKGPLTCAADTNPCTTDTCSPTLGCNWPNTDPCDDGNACTGPDACDGQGRCIGDLTPAAATCNQGDGNLCNGFEQCDPASGACEHTDLDCSDGNDCTDDTCDPTATSVSAACIHTNNTATCNDQSACTTGDTCFGGLCIGTQTAVAASCIASTGNVCDGLATCDPVSGACTARVPLNCDDANPCTTDSCDATLGCQHVQLTGTCDDGNACTVGDTCVNGACLGAPTQIALTCGNGNVCDGTETCDPGTGNCLAGTPLGCDDGDACNGAETCDPVTGCSSPGLPGFDAALCEIEFIIDQIQGRPTGAITGKKLPRKLTKLALRAHVKVKLASKAADPKAIALLTAGDKKLQRFVQVATKSFDLDRIQDGLMHLLTDRARSARDAIQGVKSSLH